MCQILSKSEGVKNILAFSWLISYGMTQMQNQMSNSKFNQTCSFDIISLFNWLHGIKTINIRSSVTGTYCLQNITILTSSYTHPQPHCQSRLSYPTLPRNFPFLYFFFVEGSTTISGIGSFPLVSSFRLVIVKYSEINCASREDS